MSATDPNGETVSFAVTAVRLARAAEPDGDEQPEQLGHRDVHRADAGSRPGHEPVDHRVRHRDQHRQRHLGAGPPPSPSSRCPTQCRSRRPTTAQQAAAGPDRELVVVSPNVVLTLNSVRHHPGRDLRPDRARSDVHQHRRRRYTLTLVGCPEPAVQPATPISAHSNLGGASQPSASPYGSSGGMASGN